MPLHKLFCRLGLAAFLGLNFLQVTSQPTRAESSEFPRYEEPAFKQELQRYRYVPGGANWYQIVGSRSEMRSGRIPGPVIGELQTLIRGPVCKVVYPDGRVFTNLKPCLEDHPRMDVFDRGILKLPRNSESLNSGPYFMEQVESDVLIARFLQTRVPQFRWPAPVVVADAPERPATDMRAAVSAARPAARSAASQVDYLIGTVGGQRIRLQLVAE